MYRKVSAIVCSMSPTCPVDVLTCSGSKWLCGPYGTGFCWVRAPVFDSLVPAQFYWQPDDPEASLIHRASPPMPSGRPCYDIFATANFLNYVPWTAAIECLLELGVSAISAHINRWVKTFREGLHLDTFELPHPGIGSETSALIFVSHK